MKPLRILTATFLLSLTWSSHALPLWQLEGTQNRIIILGSVHFLRAEDSPLPAAITRAYDEADVIVFEIDLSQIDLLELQALLTHLALDKDGRDLEDILGDRRFRTAKKLAADIDINLETLRAYEPWYAAMQITQMRLGQLGFDGRFGVETTMTLNAVADGKPIEGLESIEDQFSALDSLSESAQGEFLMQTLEDAVALDDGLDAIITAWKSGDTATLETELLQGMAEQQSLYQNILVQRNENWTKQIIDLAMQPDDYLIIVGALHLVGQDSVLRMLDDAGIASRQLK